MPLIVNTHKLPALVEHFDGDLKIVNTVGFNIGVFCMVAGINSLPDDAAMASAYKRLFVYEKVFGAMMHNGVDDVYLSDPALFPKFKGLQTNCSPMTDAAWKKHFFHLVDREVRV